MIEDNSNLLTTTESIKDIILQFLEDIPIKPGSELRTAAFHWMRWSGGQKKTVRAFVIT
jgi:hypothetical protein